LSLSDLEHEFSELELSGDENLGTLGSLSDLDIDDGLELVDDTKEKNTKISKNHLADIINKLNELGLENEESVDYYLNDGTRYQILKTPYGVEINKNNNYLLSYEDDSFDVAENIDSKKIRSQLEAIVTFLAVEIAQKE